MIARLITTHAKRCLGWLAFTGIMVCFLTSASAATSKAAGSLGVAEEPIGRTVSEGGHVTLSLSVTGAAPISYQWWKDGQPLSDDSRISGAGGPVLNIDPVITNHTGTYFAVATNSSGAVTSASVSVACLRLGIAIAVQGN